MFFFLLPVGVEYRARRYPVVTFTLMGLCMAVYLVTLILGIARGDVVDEWVFENLWLIPANSYWWTYVTSLFVHDGFFHLAGNMVYLFLFGACVEDVIGRPRFILFYLLCGLAADFTYIATAAGQFASEVPLGGASGAISGCIGGFLVLFTRTRIEFKWLFFFMFRIWNGEFFLPAWVVISFWFLADLFMMVLTVGDEGGGVAFAAHVGGTVVGLGLIALQKWCGMPAIAEEYDEEDTAPEPAASIVARVRAHSRATAVQPALEAPSIFLFASGAQSGPFTHSQLQQMFGAGEIPADALYWQEGMEDWSAADELRPPGTR
jgi:membrane associated rhomboid family serine protease